MDNQNISPLESVLVSCFCCGKGHLTQSLNPQTYRVTASDTDFYPSQRVWLNPKTCDFNPLTFFMQTCPNCFFTVEANGHSTVKSASAGSENLQQKQQIERHKELLSKSGSEIEKLAGAHRSTADTFARVVIKFLLGIFDEKLKDHYSNYNLARYYLRLAWVFRERQNWGNGAAADWPTLGQNLKELSQRHQELLGPAEKLQDLLDKEFLTIELDQKKSHYSYEEILRNLEQGEPAEEERPNEIWGRLNQQEGENYNYFQPSDQGFDLSGFLLELKSIWPGAPLNEQEALKISLSYYNQYFDSLSPLGATPQKIQTAYLIGELFRRTGEYPQSQKYFNLAITLGQDCLKKESQTYRSAFTQKIIDLAAQQHYLATQQQGIQF